MSVQIISDNIEANFIVDEKYEKCTVLGLHN